MYPIIDNKATGRRLRKLRKESHLKVNDLMNYMGLESQQAIYKWERGDSLPSVNNLLALSQLYGISINEIIIVKDRG